MASQQGGRQGGLPTLARPVALQFQRHCPPLLRDPSCEHWRRPPTHGRQPARLLLRGVARQLVMRPPEGLAGIAARSVRKVRRQLELPAAQGMVDYRV